MRVLVGFAIQPFVAACAAFVLFPAVDLMGRALHAGRLGNPVGAAVSLAAGAGLVAVFVTILGALPAFAWLLRRGPITRTKVLAGGALLGNAPLIVVFILALASKAALGEPIDLDLASGMIGSIRAVGLGSGIGTVSAGVFWLVIRRSIGPNVDVAA
jgi:hypothetical protein